MTEIPILPSGEELAEAKKKLFLPEDEWEDVDICNDWLNPEDEWESAKNAMFIGDAPVCSLGGVTILTGQSGNGKTMTIAMLASAVFRKEYGQFNLGKDIEKPTVLYVDTEMEKYNTQRLMNRVYYINGWEFKTQHPEFRVLRLRDTVDVATRWKKVLKAIHETRPTFCILDGLLDLVKDFNDNVECQSIIYKLMAAASWYDMAVIGVIHQNPGGDKMAGHLGSFGERKAITTLATKKDKNGNEVLFVVEQKKARDKDAEDFKFRVNDDNLHIGIPEPIVEHPTEIQVDESKHKELVDAMVATEFKANGKSWTELEGNLKAAGFGRNQRQRMIKEAVNMGILNKADNGRYYLMISSNSIPQEQDAPF